MTVSTNLVTCAAVYGRLEIVKRLHEAGADICAVTDGGLTAMDWGKVTFPHPTPQKHNRGTSLIKHCLLLGPYRRALR